MVPHSGGVPCLLLERRANLTGIRNESSLCERHIALLGARRLQASSENMKLSRSQYLDSVNFRSDVLELSASSKSILRGSIRIPEVGEIYFLFHR